MKSVKEEIAELLRAKRYGKSEIEEIFEHYRLIDRLGTEIRKKRAETGWHKGPGFY